MQHCCFLAIRLWPLNNTDMAQDPHTLEKLRLSLPRGYRQEIARRLNSRFSIEHIRLVVNGQRNNDEILAELLKYAKEEKVKAENMRRAIEQL